MIRKHIIFLFALSLAIGCSAQKEVVDITFQTVDTADTDSIRTLKSLKKTGDLYMMTYYNDYRHRLDEVDQRILYDGLKGVRGSRKKTIECSMFAALGPFPLYGRNFDNPPCGLLVTLYRPVDGYASIGFSRINDLGFEKEEDPTRSTIEKRRLLLNAPFFTPDGMNECGVSVALAALRTIDIEVDRSKKSIFITRLVREILDYANNIDEAVDIVRQHNVFDSGFNKVSHHLLISDPSGRSVIVEYADKGWKVMPNKNSWQVITNSPLYRVAGEQRKQDCWRYKRLDEALEKADGNVDWEQGMDLLRSVSLEGTQWSTIFNMKKKEIYISVYRDYTRISRIAF